MQAPHCLRRKHWRYAAGQHGPLRDAPAQCRHARMFQACCRCWTWKFPLTPAFRLPDQRGSVAKFIDAAVRAWFTIELVAGRARCERVRGLFYASSPMGLGALVRITACDQNRQATPARVSALLQKSHSGAASTGPIVIALRNAGKVNPALTQRDQERQQDIQGRQ